jgi:hypothetical protein
MPTRHQNVARNAFKSGRRKPIRPAQKSTGERQKRQKSFMPTAWTRMPTNKFRSVKHRPSVTSQKSVRGAKKVLFFSNVPSYG